MILVSDFPYPEGNKAMGDPVLIRVITCYPRKRELTLSGYFVFCDILPASLTDRPGLPKAAHAS